MCGIVGYVGPRDCTDVLVSALTKLEYRGYDSAGIAVFENGRIEVAKTKGRLADLTQKMEKEGKPQGHAGIGHTRWATHGEPSDVNSHPHSGRRVTIVHNGIIENYKQLKQFLIDNERTEFLSDTDTEVVAQLLCVLCAHLSIKFCRGNVHAYLLSDTLFIRCEEVELLLIYIIYALEPRALVDRP